MYGLPWPFFAAGFAIVVFTAYMGALTTDMAGTMALCIALGGLFDEIGERLPIWNTYIGGGILMAFFGTAVLKHFGILPQQYLDSINWFVSEDVNFLNFFIVFLITGSILSLDRNILLKSFAGYIPAILGGVAAAMLFGVGTGMIFGVSPTDAAIKYVLPIMGGGNGGGAVPLSQIYEQVTGDPKANYYAFAIIILTIANLMCILSGALLNRWGEKCPRLTGDKKTLLRNSALSEVKEDKKISATLKDIGGALFVGTVSYTFGRMFSKIVLPTIFGAAIHQLAYTIIFVVVLSAIGAIPDNIRAGAKRLQNFMTTNCSIIIMVGMGVDFDIMELINACSFANIVISLMIVIGAMAGSALVGYIVGFYPIDSAITAGLCMANRGGNGDLAVLGAANRMELMAYAQLSSRLGGGIILIIASFMFSFLLK
jgi:Na+/citrate or Na+/malate symporter